MEDLKEFVAAFTTKKVPHVLERTAYFTPAKKLNTEARLIYMSQRLGEQRRKRFTPSPILLEMILPHTKRICVVTEKASWMFICGRNIVKEGIVSCEHDTGPVIVVNERNEVLGWGVRSGVGVTNKYDRGAYLRRQ